MKYCAELYMSNDVVIRQIPQIAEDAIERLKREYTVPNPEFYRREKLGLWTGGTPESFALWEQRGDGLHFPFGALDPILKELHGHAYLYIKSEHAWQSAWSFDAASFSRIKLYDYQQRALNAALVARSGVIVAPCGSGKTQIGLQLAAQLGYRTLWLTHTHDLLNQSMSRAKACLDLPDESFGTITGGKVDMGKFITFATVQTMAKLDLSQYKNEWNCIIVDECHHVAGSPTKLMQFSKVVGNLSAKHKFGLTATPKRQDGLTKCMFAYLGPKIYEISKEDVGDKTCPVVVQWTDTGWDCDVDDVTNPDGTLNYTKLINEVCKDEERNKKIIHVLMDAVLNGPENPSVLVLSDRVAHLTELVKLYLDWCEDRGIVPERGWMLTGRDKKAIRDMAIDEMRSGKAKILFSTYQLAKEGLDIPNLTHLVMASPNKTDTTIVQAAGRVARVSPGKDRGTVIDFNDEFLPLMRWADKRRRIYRRLDFCEKI